MRIDRSGHAARSKEWTSSQLPRKCVKKRKKRAWACNTNAAQAQLRWAAFVTHRRERESISIAVCISSLGSAPSPRTTPLDPHAQVSGEDKIKWFVFLLLPPFTTTTPPFHLVQQRTVRHLEVHLARLPHRLRILGPCLLRLGFLCHCE
jgi:hypothetical protein